MKMTVLGKVLIGITALIATHIAQATTLTARTNVDNAYDIYVSTDDTVTGTSFGSGAIWPVTFVDSTLLTDGVTNYIHILARDLGGPAMMLGEFTLDDTDFQFANGTQTLLSGDAGIQVSLTGFGAGYTATTSYGTNNVPSGTWGGPQVGVDSNAQYVWTNDNENDNTVYFSFAVFASSQPPTVSEPATLGLLSLSLGLTTLGYRRRQKAASQA